MQNLIDKIKNCTKCKLYKEANKAVPGEGPIDARAMLVGQNPGQKEDKTGKPFIGRSGSFLDKILKKNNIDRQKLFITSIVKHATPDNRKPTNEEIKACLPYLIMQIEIIKPEIIVLMGKVAWETPEKEDIKYIKTYHPAAAMRFPKYREKFVNDFKNFSELYHD
jgi:DNA polymerase